MFKFGVNWLTDFWVNSHGVNLMMWAMINGMYKKIWFNVNPEFGLSLF